MIIDEEFIECGFLFRIFYCGLGGIRKFYLKGYFWVVDRSLLEFCVEDFEVIGF